MLPLCWSVLLQEGAEDDEEDDEDFDAAAAAEDDDDEEGVEEVRGDIHMHTARAILRHASLLPALSLTAALSSFNLFLFCFFCL